MGAGFEYEVNMLGGLWPGSEGVRLAQSDRSVFPFMTCPRSADTNLVCDRTECFYCVGYRVECVLDRHAVRIWGPDGLHY